MAEGPTEVFAAAGVAVEAGDWAGLFQRLTLASIERVASNTLLVLVGTPELRAEVLAMLEAMGEPTAPIQAMLDLDKQILASAQASIKSSDDDAAMMEDSREHWSLVKDHQKAKKGIVKSWKDRRAVAAALETLMRTRTGKGSVSSRLFVGETLTGLEMGEKKARAVRTSDGRGIAPVGFERRRDGWLIHLFAR